MIYCHHVLYSIYIFYFQERYESEIVAVIDSYIYTLWDLAQYEVKVDDRGVSYLSSSCFSITFTFLLPGSIC